MIKDLEVETGVTFFDYQVLAIKAALAQQHPQRRLLYFKTGAGKTVTALAQLRAWDQRKALVICPPSTNDQWVEQGRIFGIDVEPMSHAKFRMKSTKLGRNMAVLADEFHLFGGHGGQGWKKLDQLARGLWAPMILMSATPNYNDAERCYCIQHVLDPHSCKGGFLEFLYQHCNTRQNPFGMVPLVDETRPFRNFTNAAEYLSSLPNVDYLADDLVYTIDDIWVSRAAPTAFDTYGYNERKDRIMASDIEKRHAEVDWTLLTTEGLLRSNVLQFVRTEVKRSATPVLIFANHSTVAEAALRSLPENLGPADIVTGKTPLKKKQERIDAFRNGELHVLVGTASLATGTDGLDKVCNTLIILDDTDDDSLRRQLIGRIMPRGAAQSAAKKKVMRLLIR